MATESGIVIDVTLLQPLKALLGIRVTLLPILMVVTYIQLLNTEFEEVPMFVQLVALKLMVVKPLDAKAYCPMEVTEAGMVMDWRLVLPKNALLPIEVTELGRLTDERLVQPSKAHAPIVETELPIDTPVIPVHPLKAKLPIAVTVFGIETEVMSVQFSKE